MAAAFEPSLHRRRSLFPSLRARPDRIDCLVPSDYQYRSAGPRGSEQNPNTQAAGPYGFFFTFTSRRLHVEHTSAVGQCASAGASARNERRTSRCAPPANRRPSTAPLSRSNRSAPRGAAVHQTRIPGNIKNLKGKMFYIFFSLFLSFSLTHTHTHVFSLSSHTRTHRPDPERVATAAASVYWCVW